MHWGLGSSGFCRRSTLRAGRGLSHAPGGDRVRLAPRPHTAPFAALFAAASSMPPPMHPRPRAARLTLPLCAPDLFTLSTPLVATLTAAAAGRPPSLAATVIAPQLCCVWPRCLRSGPVRVYSGQHLQSTSFLESVQNTASRRVWRLRRAYRLGAALRAASVSLSIVQLFFTFPDMT